MALEGTAVAEPETAAPVEPTPPETTETEALEATENEGADETTETEAPEPETFTKEQVEQARKDERAKAEESARQRIQTVEDDIRAKANAQARQQRITASQRTRQGLAASELSAMFKDAEEGKELDAGRFNRLVLSLDNAAFMEQDEAIEENSNGFLRAKYPNWRPSQELSAAYTRAINGTPEQRIAARWFYMEHAIAESLYPQIRAAVEKELKESADAAAKTAGIKDAEAKREKQGRPAAVAGGAPAVRNPDQVIETAHPLSKEYAAAFEQKYGFKPPSP